MWDSDIQTPSTISLLGRGSVGRAADFIPSPGIFVPLQVPSRRFFSLRAHRVDGAALTSSSTGFELVQSPSRHLRVHTIAFGTYSDVFRARWKQCKFRMCISVCRYLKCCRAKSVWCEICAELAWNGCMFVVRPPIIEGSKKFFWRSVFGELFVCTVPYLCVITLMSRRPGRHVLPTVSRHLTVLIFDVLAPRTSLHFATS